MSWSFCLGGGELLSESLKEGWSFGVRSSVSFDGDR